MVNIPSTHPMGTITFNQIDCLLFNCLAIWSKVTYSGSKVLNHTATTEKIDSNICWGWGWLRQYFLSVSIRMHHSCGCQNKDQSMTSMFKFATNTQKTFTFLSISKHLKKINKYCFCCACLRPPSWESASGSCCISSFGGRISLDHASSKPL